MKRFLPILGLVCALWPHGVWSLHSGSQTSRASEQPHNSPTQSTTSVASQANPVEDNTGDANSRKARAIIEQAIQALGGQNYLNIRDREQQGRGYGFHHGRPSGPGSLFWSFSEFPDKERVEITPQRDIAELYVGNKAWEITYKGPHPIEQKDLDDYLRRRRYSLDSILRNWVNDPGVIFLFEGNAIAAQHPSLRVTLLNAKNESVTLYFDTDTHLPVKKTFEWRDPVDRQKNLEEEIYENYRPVSGIMAPFNVTRYFNGDMAGERFIFSVTINQGLNPAMFDPNSGYNPNKPSKH